MIADWLDQVYFGNSGTVWLTAAAVAAFVVVALGMIHQFLVSRVSDSHSQMSRGAVGASLSILRSTRFVSLLAVGVYAASHFVVLGESARSLIAAGLVIIAAYQLIVWGHLVIEFWMSRQFADAGYAGPDSDAGYSAVRYISRCVLWVLILVLVLDNLGIKITGIVAGLGIGGIAIALALQNILGDLFCSLSIVFDEPFEVGDYIVVDDFRGTVENIGIKTTRVRSIDGEEIVFSNSDLVSSRVRNYRDMKERRIALEIGIPYETPSDKVEAVPDIVRGIFDNIDKARLDRVHLLNFGESALVFEVVYFIELPNGDRTMDIRQSVNFQLLARFERAGIGFAYPTQVVRVDDGKSLSVRALSA